MIVPTTEGRARVIRGPDLVVELAKLRSSLPEHLKVVPDALAYTVVLLEHIVEYLHEDELTEH